MSTPTIKIILNYSRSGGTLLSRVLGSLEQVVLLSEINPNQNHSFHYDIRYQMKNWYGVDVIGNSFIEKMDYVYNWCIYNNKQLVIRDVSAFDFMANASNGFKPKGNFQLIQQLNEHYPLQVIGFVRDAIDVWISRDCPPSFSTHYYNYISKLIELKIPLFKYEDFCKDPEEMSKNICQTLGLEYDKNMTSKFSTYHNVTGDNQMNKKSRGIMNDKIIQVKRKKIAIYLQRCIKNDGLLQKSNQLLNYPTDYNIEKYLFEKKPTKISIELKFHLRKILKRYPKFLE